MLRVHLSSIYLAHRLWLAELSSDATVSTHDTTLSSSPLTRTECIVFATLFATHLTLGTLSDSVASGYIPSILILSIDIVMLSYVMLCITRQMMVRYQQLKYQVSRQRQCASEETC